MWLVSLCASNKMLHTWWLIVPVWLCCVSQRFQEVGVACIAQGLGYALGLGNALATQPPEEGAMCMIAAYLRRVWWGWGDPKWSCARRVARAARTCSYES